MQNSAHLLAVLPKRNSFVGCISFVAIFTTIFAGFGFVGSSLIGIFFAFLVLILSFEKIRIDTMQALSIAALFVYCAFVLILANDKFIVLQNIRYWFGVLLYILFFVARPDTRLISFGVVRFLCASILMESLFINMVSGGSELLHPGINEIGVIFMGWYERPLSFAGNPGTSGMALLVLFFLVEKLLNIKAAKLDLLLLFFAIVALVSSTAIAGFVLLLVFRVFNAQQLRYALIRAFIPILFIFYILLITDANFIQKFSIDYFIEVFHLKLLQIEGISQNGMLNQLFGNQLIDGVAKTSGDFGWLVFFTATGWLGFGVYSFLIISFYSGGRALLPVLLLMLIGTIHYPSAMSPAGQLIMAMVLTFGSLYKKQERYSECRRAK